MKPNQRLHKEKSSKSLCCQVNSVRKQLSENCFWDLSATVIEFNIIDLKCWSFQRPGNKITKHCFNYANLWVMKLQFPAILPLLQHAIFFENLQEYLSEEHMIGKNVANYIRAAFSDGAGHHRILVVSYFTADGITLARGHANSTSGTSQSPPIYKGCLCSVSSCKTYHVEARHERCLEVTLCCGLSCSKNWEYLDFDTCGQRLLCRRILRVYSQYFGTGALVKGAKFKHALLKVKTKSWMVMKFVL